VVCSAAQRDVEAAGDQECSTRRGNLSVAGLAPGTYEVRALTSD